MPEQPQVFAQLPDRTDPPDIFARLGEESGELAYDIGANTGQSALLLARSFRYVETFEPCSESFMVLKTRVPANVYPRRLAVSDHDGEVTLTECPTSLRTGQLTSGTALNWGPVIGERNVHCVRIDTLALILGAPDFIKIDTEGHEVEVVRGGHRIFHECGPRLMIEVHRSGNEAHLRNILSNYHLEKVLHSGYDPASYWAQEHFWLFGEPKETH